MKLTKKSISWTIWVVLVVGLGSSLLYMKIHMGTKPSYLNIILFFYIVVQLPLSEYLNKRKIEDGKKEFGITGDTTLDQIETLRIERDYQEKYVKKWNLKALDK